MSPLSLLPAFPSQEELQTPAIFQAIAPASRLLGELKGAAKSLPNESIFLTTLSLQEAMASSEIENIVTTQDEAFRADLFSDYASPEAKEVAHYQEAMRVAYNNWRESQFISENMLIKMFRTLKQRDDGYRTTPDTVLLNEQTGEVVYRPPAPTHIVSLMRELEAYINDAQDNLDPLIKMALIHHRFEAIHPFPDGNGRVGRMLNVLYLCHTNLLDLPILYLSRTINATKQDYYRLLQDVRDNDAWEAWIIYMLNAVTQSADSNLRLVREIQNCMEATEDIVRRKLNKIYSKNLIDNLFCYPYTRIDFLARDLEITRPTATKYLKQLAEAGIVREEKSGRNNYYINDPLITLLTNVARQ